MAILGLAEGSIQLVPDGTLVFHIALILLMVGVLNRTLFQPINKILDDRERRGRGTLMDASELRAAASRKLAGYENALRSARAEGYRLSEVQRTEVLKERDAQLNSVKMEMNRLLESEKQAIKSQVEEASRTLQGEAQILAAEIKERVLHP